MYVFSDNFCCSIAFTYLCWASESDRLSCNKKHECVKLRAFIINCHLELVQQGPDWAMVQILDRLTFTWSDAGRTVSVSDVSTLGTDFFVTKNFNEWTTNPLSCRYRKKSLDCLSWQWTSGCSLGPIRAKFMNKNIYALSKENVLIHSGRAAC